MPNTVGHPIKIHINAQDDFSTSAGLKYCWYEDTNTHASSAEFAVSVGAPGAGYIPTRRGEYNVGFAARKGILLSSDHRGHFSFIIPLNHIFGFAEYRKVTYGQKHTLTLTRGSDTRAIHRANGVDDGKIDITSIT